MSGKGPQNDKAEQSKYTKPLREAYEDAKAEERNSDHKFKKVFQTVGKPQTTNHNVMDDYVKQPPHNREGEPAPDYIPQEERRDNSPNTVEAKSVEEIQARLDKLEQAKH